MANDVTDAWQIVTDAWQINQRLRDDIVSAENALAYHIARSKEHQITRDSATEVIARLGAEITRLSAELSDARELCPDAHEEGADRHSLATLIKRDILRHRKRDAELEDLRAQLQQEREQTAKKIQMFRLYLEHHAHGARGTSFRGPHYNPADLCASNANAVRQLQEYLDPLCDSYLTALVESAAATEGTKHEGTD